MVKHFFLLLSTMSIVFNYVADLMQMNNYTATDTSMNKPSFHISGMIGDMKTKYIIRLGFNLSSLWSYPLLLCIYYLMH